jgi:hypothetical protein
MALRFSENRASCGRYSFKLGHEFMKKYLLFTVLSVFGCASNYSHITSSSIQDESFQTFNFEVPDAMNVQISDVLRRFEGDVLYPNHIETIDLSDIKPGTIFEYESTGIASKRIFKYLRSDSDYYYFELQRHVDGEVEPFIYRTNGIVGEAAPADQPNRYSEYPITDNSCKFKIGECEYTIGQNIEKVTTTFENGVWSKNSRVGLTGLAYITTKEIYDKNGMLIYSGTFSNRWTSGKHDYTIRIN